MSRAILSGNVRLLSSSMGKNSKAKALGEEVVLSSSSKRSFLATPRSLHNGATFSEVTKLEDRTISQLQMSITICVVFIDTVS